MQKTQRERERGGEEVKAGVMKGGIKEKKRGQESQARRRRTH